MGVVRRSFDWGIVARVHWKALGVKGLSWLLPFSLAYRSVETVSLPGNHGTVTLRPNTGDIYALYQVFVKEEYAADFVTPPKVILDAGAHIGLATRWFAIKFPESRIIAIEPEAENFGLLVANTRHLSNVIPLQAALASEAGERALIDPGGGSWAYQTAMPQDVGDTAMRLVRTVTVPELMSEFSVERICLLKMDIEGAEAEVLEHSPEWVSQVDCMAVELHDRFRRGCSYAFYTATEGFALEWRSGELVFVSREGVATPPQAITPGELAGRGEVRTNVSPDPSFVSEASE